MPTGEYRPSSPSSLRLRGHADTDLLTALDRAWECVRNFPWVLVLTLVALASVYTESLAPLVDRAAFGLIDPLVDETGTAHLRGTLNSRPHIDPRYAPIWLAHEVLRNIAIPVHAKFTRAWRGFPASLGKHERNGIVRTFSSRVRPTVPSCDRGPHVRPRARAAERNNKALEPLPPAPRHCNSILPDKSLLHDAAREGWFETEFPECYRLSIGAFAHNCTRLDTRPARYFAPELLASAPANLPPASKPLTNDRTRLAARVRALLQRRDRLAQREQAPVYDFRLILAQLAIDVAERGAETVVNILERSTWRGCTVWTFYCALCFLSHAGLGHAALNWILLQAGDIEMNPGPKNIFFDDDDDDELGLDIIGNRQQNLHQQPNRFRQRDDNVAHKIFRSKSLSAPHHANTKLVTALQQRFDYVRQ